MADLADVESALLATLAAALPTYPAVRLYRGWPVAAALGADIAAGMANVTVFSVAGSGRNTTRWGTQRYRSAPIAGLTVSQQGNTVLYGGLPTSGDLAGLLLDNQAYVYAVEPADTPTSVAAALADLVRAEFACLQANAMLTFPTAPNLVARVTASATVVSEWRRQTQDFRISVWAGSPAQRDALSSTADAALAPLAFLPLADGSSARVRGHGSVVIDDDRDASIYRRDILVDAEYATTTTELLPTMLFGDLNWNGIPYFG